jgi:aspartyl-tRNA(Asn)/glutamyl-tRNA(Gln) amidotransferase subunit B
VQRAIDVEIQRQIEIAERGEKIISETRTFDAGTGSSRSMRVKEELNDYRYFPDPDLSPLMISDVWLDSIKHSMPALPNALYEKFITQYTLSAYDAGVLTETKELAAYFESVCTHTKNYKAVANWIMGPVKSYLNEHSATVAEFSLPDRVLAQLIELIDAGTVNFSVASQRLFPELIKNPEKLPLEIAQTLNLIQDGNHDSILPIIEQIMADFPEKVVEYRKGKNGIVGMFMGEVMKRSKGKADPKAANELLLKKLEEV